MVAENHPTQHNTPHHITSFHITSPLRTTPDSFHYPQRTSLHTAHGHAQGTSAQGGREKRKWTADRACDVDEGQTSSTSVDDENDETKEDEVAA